MSAREIPPTRRGYDAREVVSAVQKSIRRSDVHAAMYWASELQRSGYGQWLWRRLSVIVHEDVAPDAGVTAEFWALKEMYGAARTAAVTENPDAGSMEMLHAVVLLASAKKGRLIQWAVFAHYGDHMERLEIPDEALDQHTNRGRALKRGYEHFFEEAAKLEDPEPGVLERLEAEYREMRRREKVEKAKDLPENPWRPAHGRETDQMTMTIEESER